MSYLFVTSQQEIKKRSDCNDTIDDTWHFAPDKSKKRPKRNRWNATFTKIIINPNSGIWDIDYLKYFPMKGRVWRGKSRLMTMAIKTMSNSVLTPNDSHSEPLLWSSYMAKVKAAAMRT